MELKQFIDYYKTCPICDGDMVIDATDIGLPSTTDKAEDGLLLSVYQNREPYKLKLLYSGKIDCDKPFIMNSTYSALRRRLQNIPPNAYDKLQLEIWCVECHNFRYWSNHIIFDPINKTFGDINVKHERAQFKTKKDWMILFLDSKRKEFLIYDKENRSSKLPYIETLKFLPLNNTKKIILDIRKQLLIS